jgi:hypothetical protein
MMAGNVQQQSIAESNLVPNASNQEALELELQVLQLQQQLAALRQQQSPNNAPQNG